MEKFLFESLITQEQQINQLQAYLEASPEILQWHVLERENGVIITVEGLRITAFEIASNLQENGFVVERLYED